MATVYFDLDGTLTTYGDDFRELFDRAVPGDQPDGVYDLYVKEILDNLEQMEEKPYLEAFRTVSEEFDLDFDPEEVAEKYVRIEVESTRAHGEVKELLRKLSKNHRVGILTNGDGRVQRLKIEENGLDELTDEIIVSNNFGARKPDKEIFEEAKRRLPAESYVFVGDTYDEDIEPAERAGFRTVYINGEKEADVVAGTPEDIAGIINLLT